MQLVIAAELRVSFDKPTMFFEDEKFSHDKLSRESERKGRRGTESYFPAEIWAKSQFPA